MLIPGLFAVFLVLASGILAASHRRSWRAAKEQALEGEALEFAHGQYRRRIQTSGMIALTGVLIFIGQWISGGVLVLLFYLAVVLIILWIMLLAMADGLATRVHFSRLQKDELMDQIRLQADLKRAKNDLDFAERRGRNGKQDEA